jgi:hypothetical protein
MRRHGLPGNPRRIEDDLGWIRRKHSDHHAVAPSIPPSKPLARSEDLVVEELGDELLVYDLTTDQAHALGAAAARVWRACDGKSDALALGVELGLDGETVTRALEELRGCGLLEQGPQLAPGISRRDLGVRVAKVGGAVAATPLIVSLAAPLPAAAQTVTPLFCSEGITQGCGIQCMVRNCCCCCQMLDPDNAIVMEFCPDATGSDMCCLPTTPCEAGTFGIPPMGSNCADTAPCP